MKRIIKFNGIDKEFEVAKAVEIDIPTKQFIYFEKMKDNKWRIAWTKNLIEDFKKLSSIEIVRQDD